MASLKLRTNEDAAGYFTLLTGSSANCGTSAQVKAGQTANDAIAPYFGSLSLIANTVGTYTIRDLTKSTDYTVCVTAVPTPTPEVVSLNLTTTAGNTFVSPGWTAVGGAGFSAGYAHFTSLAFAADGAPYLAYVDANDSYKITVTKFNGSTWELAGASGFARGTANPASLRFAPEGTPHIAYIDAVSSKATVMSFNGNSWTPVGTPLFIADTDSASLAFAPDRIPYVAYIDGSDSRAAVMKYSAGAWSSLGNSGLSPSGAWFNSLAISPAGTVYIAYSDYGNSGKATVMKYNGTSWTSVGSAGFSAGTVTNTSLAIAPNGTPYLAYQDGGVASKATVMEFDGNAWVPVGTVGFSTGPATNTSLAIASDGSPYVAYQDGGNSFKATVMKYISGGNWLPVGNVGFSAGTANSTSLAFAPDDTPYVAYGDDGNSSRATVTRLIDIPPTISGIPATAATVGGTYNFTPTATYANNFTISNLPSWASFNAASGKLSGTPTTNDIGSYSNIIISAWNSIGFAELPPFSIEVTAATAGGSVKIGTSAFPTISAALAVAISGNTLNILSSITPEGVNFSGTGILTLAGGYDAGWNRQLNLSSPVNSITITSGTLIFDMISVQ